MTVEKASSPVIAFGGTIDKTPIVDVFRNLYVERKTAQILVARMGEERTIWLDRGQLISAASNREAQLVGELLRTFGLADDTILFTAFERALAEPGRGLAKALRETGAVPGYIAEACVRALAERILFDTCRFTSGTFTVMPLEKPPDLPFRFDQSNANLILEAYRRLPPDAPRPGQKIDPRSRPFLTRDLILRYQTVTLLKEEADALSAIDGVKPASDLTPDVRILDRLRATGLVQIPLPGQNADKGVEVEGPAILNLEIAGAPPNPRAVEMVERQTSVIWNTYRRLDWASLYEVVGVAGSAPLEEVRAALHERARLFHPDHALKTPLNDAREALEALFSRVRNADTVFRTPESRTAYDRTQQEGGQLIAVESAGPALELQKSLAKANYTRARDLMEVGDFYPAYEMVRQAVEFDPDRPEYWILLSRVQRKNPKWVRQASETLRRANERILENAELLFELSEAYAAERNETERVKALKRVLQIDSGNRRAQAALAEIASGKPSR